MDYNRIGLDFGTHQTKICICRIPDEGHGIPEYEFMKFQDLEGKEHYFIPSVIQINDDDTLSYGFVDSRREKNPISKPVLKEFKPVNRDNIDNEVNRLYNKYCLNQTDKEDALKALHELLEIKMKIDANNYKKRVDEAQRKYEAELKEYHKNRNVFRYFKQATLSQYIWHKKYDSKLLCIWYLAYIIFLLEKRFETNFFINLGVPAGEQLYSDKRKIGFMILRSAFYLVEDVYKNDITLFLNEKVDDLLNKTKICIFSESEKEEFHINIFPEAYASLIGLTSRGKLSEGMSINADIGGGTTDISFFIVNKGLPKIYKYWSLPFGLNYIAELSGYDYSEINSIKDANKDVIRDFNTKKENVVYNLELKLIEMIREKEIPRDNLINALRNRIVVYNGGGSTFSDLTVPISRFTDVVVNNTDYWKEENIKNKEEILEMSSILITAYGLSESDKDKDVVLYNLDSIFSNISNKKKYEKEEIDKDVC